VNELLDDAGAGVVDAVGAGAGGGAESPPVRLLDEVQPVSVATTAAAPAARRHRHRRAPSRRVSALQVFTLVMRNLHPERRRYSSGTVAGQRHPFLDLAGKPLAE
jgi:hypothetical protein